MSDPHIPDRLRLLLALGDPRSEDQKGTRDANGWLDYSAIGLGPADGPGLIAMATDKKLNRSSEPECFAPLHAWRALGQFKCEPAVRPLLDLLDHAAEYDDDWALEEIPDVLGMIGAEALADLRRFLPDQRRNMWARAGAGRAMSEIAKADPARRAEVVKSLTDQLSLSRYNQQDFNGLVVSLLIDLKAVESAAAVRNAYRAGDVNEQVCGSLNDALADMGMTADEVSAPSKDGGIDRRILDEVMREYNEKQRAVPDRTPGPMTRAEHEAAMRDIQAMLRSRSAMGKREPGAADEPRSRAQALADRAVDSDSIRESLALAEEALALDPDCVDALMLKAERTIRDPDELIASCERAVGAGERALGIDCFNNNTGEFWAMIETRPYVRARARLASLLRTRGRTDEAVSHFECLLELNRGDNLGLRYMLIGCYLEQGRTDAMAELIARFKEDSAFFLWPKVFMHVLENDQTKAKRALSKARRTNPHVEGLIAEVKPMPRNRPAMYSPGGPDEAIFVAESLFPALKARSTLREWLVQQRR